jgi:hypothetical protein
MKTKLGAQVGAALAEIAKQIEQIDSRLASIANEMANLKAAGLIYAGEHLRDGKYFYLIYPSQNGAPRKREYVGIDPERITEARAGIARAKLYESLKRDQERLEARLNAASFRLRHSVLSGGD